MNGLIIIPWRGYVSMSVDLLDTHEMALSGHIAKCVSLVLSQPVGRRYN
jgi:hypothetical protein